MSLNSQSEKAELLKCQTFALKVLVANSFFEIILHEIEKKRELKFKQGWTTLCVIPISTTSQCNVQLYFGHFQPISTV